MTQTVVLNRPLPSRPAREGTRHGIGGSLTQKAIKYQQLFPGALQDALELKRVWPARLKIGEREPLSRGSSDPRVYL